MDNLITVLTLAQENYGRYNWKVWKMASSNKRMYLYKECIIYKGINITESMKKQNCFSNLNKTSFSLFLKLKVIVLHKNIFIVIYSYHTKGFKIHQFVFFHFLTKFKYLGFNKIRLFDHTKGFWIPHLSVCILLSLSSRISLYTFCLLYI